MNLLHNPTHGAKAWICKDMPRCQGLSAFQLAPAGEMEVEFVDLTRGDEL